MVCSALELISKVLAKGSAGISAEAPPLRSKVRLRIGGASRVWILNLLLAASTVGVYSVFVQPLDAPPAPIRIPWWVIAVLFGLAEIFVVHLEIRRNAHSLSLSEIPLVLGLFFTDPQGLVLAHVVGASAALAFHRRQSPIKLAFNVSHFSLETVLAITVFYSITSSPNPFAPATWLAAMLASGITTLVGILLIVLAMSLSEGTSYLTTVPRGVALGATATLANACTALIVITILWNNPWGTWLLAVPIAVLFLAYRAYVSHRQRHQSLEFLYETIRMLQRSAEVESAIEGLLSQARKMFRAEIAEIDLFLSSTQETALRSVIGPGGHVEIGTPVEFNSDERAFSRKISAGPALLFARPVDDPEAAALFASRGVKDGMAACLYGEDGVIGWLLVANRLGEVSTFDREDLKLFETLANHSSLTLESGRLEKSLRRLEELNRLNEHQALHDSLTGLPNRTFFRSAVEKALKSAGKDDRGGAVLIIDLDRFKEVNDTLGHHTGDLLLQGVGQRLKATLRGVDTIARLGGDEFAVVLPAMTDPTAAIQVAQKIQSALDQPFSLKNLTLDIEASIGIALYPEHAEDVDTLLQRADVAMYLVKETHGGYGVYSPERDQHTPRRLSLLGDLRRAIAGSELRLFYQPKADIRTGEITDVEALVRWENPRHGPVLPDEFIPLAQHTGLIRPLTLWVLNEAIKQVHLWQQEGINLGVAVNLAPRNMQDLTIPDEIESLLQTWGVRPERLTLEITESAITDDPLRATEVLTRLNSMGVRLALDDFGTGYSSLAHLKRLPVGEIKIDKSFVINMITDENDAAIVKSTIELGRSLGLTVVAEGVETLAVWSLLDQLGCDVAQGFYLSEPLSADQFATWLDQTTRQPSLV